jgi:hypothetical protein
MFILGLRTTGSSSFLAAAAFYDFFLYEMADVGEDFSDFFS